VIRAERHMHMNLDHARHYGVKNGDVRGFEWGL
jgi:propanediol utilization protein